MSKIESFNTIFEKAEERKGGYEELITMLPTLFSDAELMRLSDALYLERLTRCIFVSGFSSKVIRSKWDGFMDVFQEFDLKKLSEFEDEDWHYSMIVALDFEKQCVHSGLLDLMFVPSCLVLITT